MSPRRLAAVVGIILAVALAVVLALIAGSALSVEDEFAADRAAAESAAGGHGFRAEVADFFLGVDDDRELRRAIVLIEEGEKPGAQAREVLAQHGEAIARLTRLRTKGDPEWRSYVSTRIGLLYFEDARLDVSSRRRYSALAVEAFLEAVSLDPENEAAKYNLEVLLAQQKADAAGEGAVGGSGSGGASEAPLGSGY